MLLLKIATALLLSIDVQVELLNGESAAGILSAVNSSEVALTVDGAAQKFPLSEVILIEQTSQPTPAADSEQGQLLLANGARLSARLEELSAQNAAATTTIGPVQLPRVQLRAVRLSPENRDWDDQWQSFLKRDNDEDLLILKKRDGSGLDFYGGAISGMSGDKIDFVLDGDAVPVPRQRVYGLIFTDTAVPAVPAVRITLSDQSTLTAAALSADAESLKIRTSWGEEIPAAWSSIRSIDFSSGRFHYLSDLDPVKETYNGIHPRESVLEDLLQDDEELRNAAMRLWKLHRDQLPMGPLGPLPLTLRGRVYRKGVWLFPSCRIDYALDGRYSQFQALAGVDDEVAWNCSDGKETSKVRLTVLSDGDEVWNQLIDAPADPVRIGLDVTGVRTLSLVVDFGDEDNACDFLDLADARLLVAP